MEQPPGLKKTSAQRALEYLSSFLEKGNYHPGTRLPKILRLASNARVGVASMCAAVRALQAQQRITPVRGHGLLAGAPPKKALENRPEKWRRTVLAIESDIFAGAFEDGHIPSLAEMTRRYGVSFRCLKKAIDDLLDRGILLHHRRWYRVSAAVGQAHPYASILFLSVAYEGGGGVVILNDRFKEVNYTLERECRKSGIRFERKGILNSSPFEWPGDTEDGRSHIGFIIYSNGLNAETLRQVCIRAAQAKRPVAIIDETGDIDSAGLLRSTQAGRTFAIAGLKAGQNVARFLHSLGHQKVLFLQSAEAQQWSRSRLEGLHRYFDGLAAVPGSTVRLMSSGIEAGGPGQDDASVFGPMTDRLFSQCGFLVPDYEPYRGTVLITLGFVQSVDSLRQLLVPVLKKHVGPGGATAIVAENDKLALASLLAARSCGLQVPRDISITGFDDAPEAYQYDLTSYNFSFAGIAQQAFTFLLHPASPQFASGERRIECEGIIMERGSAGVASAQHYHGQ
jgi:DNA-binding LacI/PurR family transcriptional regulator/DNA-binding transcriptional regulator YhcF (GntR family)